MVRHHISNKFPEVLVHFASRLLRSNADVASHKAVAEFALKINHTLSIRGFEVDRSCELTEISEFCFCNSLINSFVVMLIPYSKYRYEGALPSLFWFVGKNDINSLANMAA